MSQDVQAFLVAPWKCTYGESPAAGLFDFVTDLGDDLVKGLIESGPLDVLFDFVFEKVVTSLQFKEITEPMCGFFDIIDSIATIAQGTGNAVKTVIDGVTDVKSAVNAVDGVVNSVKGVADSILGIVNILNVRRRMIETTISPDDSVGEMELTPCTGHMTPCYPDEDSVDMDCGGCVTGAEDGCSSHCHVCYQKLPEIDGVCVTVRDAESLSTGDVSLGFLQHLQTSMLARHLEKITDTRVKEALHRAFDVKDSASIAALIIESIAGAQEDITNSIHATEQRIQEKADFLNTAIHEQCPSTAIPKRGDWVLQIT